MLFWKGSPSERLNKRVMGTVKGSALRKAKRVIDMNGSLNMSGIYGSIVIDVSDGFYSRLRVKKKMQLHI